MSAARDVKCQLQNNLRKVEELEEEIKFLYKNCKSMIGYPLVGELTEDSQLFSKDEIMQQSISVSEKWIAVLQNFNAQLNAIHRGIEKNIHHYQNEATVEANKVKTGIGFDSNKIQRKINLD